MIRYVFVLLAINIYSCSLEASLVNNSLKNLLNDLSAKCGSSFLSLQIQDKIKDCNVAVPPYGEKQLQCLMFYDMSRNMCSVLSSKINLGFNITDINIVKANQSVAKLCNDTKFWKFHNIPLYPDYIVEVDNIRYNNIACYKLCSEDDFRSSNSNFFCKYFKWGSDILKSLETSINDIKNLSKVSETNHNKHGLIKATNNEDLQDSRVLNATPKQDVIKAYDNMNAPTHEISSVRQLNSSVSNTNNQLTSVNAKIVKVPLPNQNSSGVDKITTSEAHVVKDANEGTNGTIFKLEHTQETSTNPELKTETEKQKILTDIYKLYESLKQQSSTGGSQLKLGNTIKQIPTSFSPSTDQQVGEKQQLPLENPSLQDIEPSQGVIVPSQKFQLEEDDYESDADEGSEPKPFLKEAKTNEEQRNINTETRIEAPFPSSHVGNSLKYPDADEDREPKPFLKDTETKIEAPLSSSHDNNSPKEFSAQEQEEFADEDDNFFPFFLTAVILVILIYVFYHNKNRVLGLIVEGRQSNRRRNSRGHAYRRLDTLEQAMSGGNGATPPSKIIY